MPFVKAPIASDNLGNQHVDGGVSFMYGAELDETWGLGLMFEVNYPYDKIDDSYNFKFVHTIVLGRPLTGDLAGYVEHIGIASTDEGTDYQALIGTGYTYGLDEHTSLDLGVNIGLNRVADDVNIFSGITVRF